MEKFDNVEREVIELLKQVAKEGYVEGTISGNKQWTRRIKELLAEAGTDRNYSVCTAGFPGTYDPEWLYDLVWYRNAVNEENSRVPSILETVPLVLESEWSGYIWDVRYDFEKLLLANADHRVMICETLLEEVNNYKSYFEKAVKTFRNLPYGARFLIAIIDKDGPGEFHFHQVIKN